MNSSMSFDDLLGYNAFLADTWQKYFQKNTSALEMPCDIMNTGSVRQLVKHIFAVELRYAEQLNGRAAPEYDQLADVSLEDLYSIRERGVKSLQEFLRSASEQSLDQNIDVQTRSAGTLSATRRTILIHSLLHGARHWAQIATLARQAGYPSIGFQDYLFYKVGK